MRSARFHGYDGWPAAIAVALLPLVVMEVGLQRYRLDNGLSVLVAPQRSAPVVAVQAWVGVGSADESRRLAGISHVFEHMLFKGTERRGVGEIARAVEAAGGDINAWTSFNQTVYHVVLASRYFDIAVDVLADALMHSSFDAGELEREREVILEEIRQSHDDPTRTLAQTLFSTAYVKHPYRLPVIGDAGRIRAMGRPHLLEFFRTWYVADNVTLVVAGDVDPERARRDIEARFRGMPRGEVPRAQHREPRQRAPRAKVVAHDVNEAQFALGFHTPPLRSPETAAIDLAAVILGQGESSRLAMQVRRRLELVTGVYSYVHSLRDPGLFVVSAGARPEKLAAAAETVATEIYRLAIEEVSRAELEKARHAVEADTVYQLETAEGLARKFGYYEMMAGDAEFELSYLDQVRRVTAADVRAAAARYLTLDNTTAAAVVPDRGAARTEAGREAAARRLLSRVRRGHAAAQRRYAVPRVAMRADGDIVRETLPNGLRLLIKRDPTVPIVAMRAVWPGGLRLETPKNNGVNHLLAAAINRGCGARSAEQMVAAIDDMAGSLTGFSGRSSFGVRAEWLAARWEEGFDLVADCLLAPHFSPDELAREKRRVLDEIDARAESPTFVVFRAFAEALYRKHPYRMDVMGTATSVADLERRDVAGFYRRNYPVSELTLAVVGDVDPARVRDRVRERFGATPARARAERRVPKERFEGRPAASREVYRYLDRQQAHLIVGFPGATLDDPDRYALDVLTTILGGQGGRLFVELRDRQALAYRVGAYSLEGIDPGYVAVYMACSPDKLGAAVAGIRAELDRLVAEPVPPEELERAVRYLVGSHDISLQRRAALASAMAFHEAYGLGYDQYQRYAAAISAVTPADVQRVAARFLSWDLAVTATVRPPALSPAAERRARGVRSKPPRARPRSR